MGKMEEAWVKLWAERAINEHSPMLGKLIGTRLRVHIYSIREIDQDDLLIDAAVHYQDKLVVDGTFTKRYDFVKKGAFIELLDLKRTEQDFIFWDPHAGSEPYSLFRKYRAYIPDVS